MNRVATLHPSDSVLSWPGRIWAHRELLGVLAMKQVRVKYKQSVMGILWAIFMPLLIVSAGVLIKVLMARLSGSTIESDAIALVAVKSVPWAFFTVAIKSCSMSLISHRNLVTKIYMPREVFPLAEILAQLLDFAVAALTLSLILPFIGIDVGPNLLLIPVFIVLLVVLAAGWGLFLSATSLFFRDVKYLVDVFFTFAIFFTPVFYEAADFGEWAPLLLANPVAPILEGLGAAVVGTPFPPVGWIIYSAVFAIAGLFGSLVLFKRMEPYFAESV